MGARNIIRVAEYEKIYYDNDKPFKKKHWEALCRYHANNEIEFFQIINGGIRFINYVGVIQAGNLTIEVLPKTDRKRTTAANCTIQDLATAGINDASSRESWHHVLLAMLRECKLLQVHHSHKASLNLQSNSILDIYIELFLDQTTAILHEGLTKKYRKREGNQLAMKGQLIFSKNITQNLVHQERFYVRHTIYDVQNRYNQLLYMTLQMIPDICNHPLLLDKANRLLLHFPEFTPCKVTEHTFSSLTFDRKTERYKEVLEISRMLLLHYRPDITGGGENVIAILFDMNTLWEEFIFRRLQKAAGADIKVSRQNKKDFWHHGDFSYYKKIKPDIVVEINNSTYILDTKWKVLDKPVPSDDDLKQLFVYNLLWNAQQSFLVYPGNTQSIQGSFVHFPLSEVHRRSGELFYNHCTMTFINPLTSTGRLCPDIGHTLLSYISNRKG